MITIHPNGSEPFSAGYKVALTVGNFDGVHRGHAALIDACVSYGKAHEGVLPAAFCFTSHPHLGNGNGGRTLSTTEEKKERLAALGVSVLFLADFSDFRGMEPMTFLRDFVIRSFGAEAFFCGTDFRFGKDRAGDGETLTAVLREAGLCAAVVPDVLYDGEKISSTAIRRCLSDGDTERANAMLDAPYSVRGTVSHGDEIGRSIGFPTANLSPDGEKLLPRRGVFCTRAEIGGKTFPAVTNVGVRPTVKDGLCETVESFLLEEPDAPLYGKEIKISFLHRIRDEMKFPDLTALQRAIAEDAARAKDYFAQNPFAAV